MFFYIDIIKLGVLFLFAVLAINNAFYASKTDLLILQVSLTVHVFYGSFNADKCEGFKPTWHVWKTTEIAK